MAFFQNSVLNKYLKGQDAETVKTAYQKFTAYFHNPAIQQNIREAKEEQFQEGFLRELFVEILGYTLNPQPNYNLTTELKNEIGAKKCDGAILHPEGKSGGKAIGVIELKGTDTKDLDKINVQAFNYKNNQTACVYVITSNFEKLRFFIHHSVEHLEFNLFTLTESEFQLLWLCLRVDNLLNGVPLKVKEESLLAEENITKQLYKDYSAFKSDLWQNMSKNHPDHNQLMLFKKTQKLLDRFLFIFFSEDSGLLPPNSISKIIEKWKQDTDWGEERKLYDIYKQYFGFINTGRPARGGRSEIFGFNGGLFLDDLILDNIHIDDEILLKHTEKLTAYDFQSEVDVNILGHIFENSLNEIESITAELEGQEVDKSKSKRKKDGVFYTPKYITKYIVENTIGKLCEEKKTELNITDERFGQASKRSRKGIADLQLYRDWLLDLKICDPACGSGAFLNQALEFLIDEHRYLDELTAQYHNSPMVLSDIETQILEQNLYGVDINEESVDIAKLSLWLRTAQKGRKLTSLNHNIKCGNSLIDDPDVAGEKAFNWQKEFPGVFHKKVKKAWHITTATHNSRYSQRMFDNYVKTGEAVWLSEKEEIIVTEKIAEISEKDKLNIIAYNICGDHMHLLIVCEDEELPKIVQKIKAMSARACNIAMGRTIPEQAATEVTTEATTEHALSAAMSDNVKLGEHAPRKAKRGKTQFHLWTQKFGCNEIKDEKHLWNTAEYIQNNRKKHKLPAINKSLQPLVDKMTCTRQHAFRTEYKGGFDVVIGNPPYIRQELFKEIKPYLEVKYNCYNSIADLYTYFIEQGINLMKDTGYFSFILPNKFMRAKYGKEIREVILNQANIELIFDFDDYPVFDDATTYPIIFVFSKVEKNKFYYSEISKRSNTFDPVNILEQNKIQVLKSSLSSESWTFNDSRTFSVLEKLKSNSVELKEFVNDKIFRGVSTGCNDVFIVDKQTIRPFKNSYNLRKIFMGKEVKRYKADFQDNYLLFLTWDYDLDSDSNIKSYLLANKEKLNARPEVKDGRFNWWCLSRYGSKNSHLLAEPKIIYPRINNECNFFLDSSGDYSLSDNNFFISSGKKDLLALLNSKLIFFYLKNNCSTLQGGYYDFRRPYIEKIPISKSLLEDNNELISFADKAIYFNSEFNKVINIVVDMVKSKFELNKLTKKIENWYELDFMDFLKELEKGRKHAATAATRGYVALTLQEQAEWMQYFNEQKQKAQELKGEIDKTDKEIDQMVYELYGLTKEEIAIVEGSNN